MCVFCAWLNVRYFATVYDESTNRVTVAINRAKEAATAAERSSTDRQPQQIAADICNLN